MSNDNLNAATAVKSSWIAVDALVAGLATYKLTVGSSALIRGVSTVLSAAVAGYITHSLLREVEDGGKIKGRAEVKKDSFTASLTRREQPQLGKQR